MPVARYLLTAVAVAAALAAIAFAGRWPWAFAALAAAAGLAAGLLFRRPPSPPPRRLLDELPDPALSFASGRLTWANQSALDLFGATHPRELIGLPLAALAHRDDPAGPGHLRALCAGTDGGQMREVTLSALDGSAVRVTAFPVATESPDEVMLSLRDLRPSIRAATELRESHRFIASVADTVPDLLYVYALEGRREVYANRRFGTLLGYDDADLAEMRDAFLARTLHPDDVRPLADHAQRLASLDNDDIVELEYRLRDKAGRWRWIASRERVFTRGGDGSPRQILGTAHDVTRRKEIEDALKRSEERFRELAETIPECFWVADAAGEVQYVSPAFEPLFGRPADLLAEGGMARFAQHVHPDDVQTFLANLAAVVRNGKGRQEYRYVRPGGEVIWLRDNAFAVRDASGAVVRYVGYCEDVTQRKAAERALSEAASEARKLALVAQATDNGVVITDADGVTEWVNEAFTAISGYALGEAKGLKPGHLLQGPGTDPAAADRMRQAIRKGEPVHVRILNYHKSGRPYWLECDVEPVFDEGHRLVKFISVQRDVTAREQADRELRERMAMAALTAEVGMILTRHDEMRPSLQRCAEALVKHVGAAFARVWTLDTSRQTLDLQASAGLYTHLDGPHASIPMGKFKIGRIAAEGKPVLTNRVVGDEQVPEQQWARENGLVSFAGNPLVVDGKVIGVLALFARHELPEATGQALASVADAVALGIQRKRAQRERDRFFALSAEPMGICDFAGAVLAVNPAAAALLGYEPADLVGRGFLDFVHPDERGRAAAAYARACEGGERLAFDFRYVRRDGGTGVLAWTVIRSPDEPVVYGVGRDVTQDRAGEAALAEAKEAAEAASRAKSEFLSRMSHELRTPLNSILGFGQLLDRPGLDDGQRESVSLILTAGRHLLRLVNDVLDVSRIEAGRLSLRPEPVEADGLLAQAADLIGPAADSRGVAVEVEPAGPDAWVVADAQRLAQALLNLLTNAVKYNRPRGRVWLRCRRAGESWRFEVEDTGPGIAAELLGRLFVPFERLVEDDSGVEGTGLGLAVARSLAEAMGGRVGVRSTPGVGSTFWLELPASAEGAAEDAAGLPPTQSGPATAGTVLYVEDNAVNRLLVEQTLRLRPGVELRTAPDGRRGLRMASESRFDLVLLDVHLGDMDGEEVLRRMRAGPTVPGAVVALSADATAAAAARLRAAGADDYLTKPLDLAELLRAIDRYLQPR